MFGEEFPVGLDRYSWVSRTELQRFLAELDLAEGDILVDLGCGRGGAGLWVAAAARARLIGMDIAANALAAARARTKAMGLRARFRLGSFERTGLREANADAVMSVDALLFTSNKPAAIAELRRMLRPGGRLVLTSWDYHRQPVGRPPQVDDHRPLLAAVGFEVLAYEATEDWRDRQRRTTDGLLAATAALTPDCRLRPSSTKHYLAVAGGR